MRARLETRARTTEGDATDEAPGVGGDHQQREAAMQNPPIIAPTRLAPKSADGAAPSRNVDEKMRPAKKTGSGTASSVHVSLPVKDKRRTASCGTA
jgi:hypothetical protein